MMTKIAIVHEWFATSGGSEKVVEQLLQIFPDADIFALIDFLPEKDRGLLRGKTVNTSFLQGAPFINGKNYRNFLPLMPLAVEQFNLQGYDVIISNCHAVSKGIISSPEQLHIGYIHTPMRYAWDMQNAYLENGGFSGVKGFIARLLLHYVRSWDAIAASRPDIVVANSKFIARRIQKIYRRNSQVIYPPVDTDYFTPDGLREDYYFTASRFVSYKRIDLIAEAFQKMPDKKLVIIGDGPERANFQRYLGGNITWLGFQPSAVVRDHLRHCQAFVFAAKEDFGIMPLEAQACGAPVIAFGEGGAGETIIGKQGEHQTGVHFQPQTAEAIMLAVEEFEKLDIQSQDCRNNAERFSNQRFRDEFQTLVNSSLEKFRKN